MKTELNISIEVKVDVAAIIKAVTVLIIILLG